MTITLNTRGLDIARSTGADPVIDLQQRVQSDPTMRRPDLDFDDFYRALEGREEQWKDDVFRFVVGYENAAGERPYRTNGEQMKILLAVLEKLKAEGLSKSDLYKDTYKAFATVFGIKGFINHFRQEAFDPGAVAKLQEDNSW